MAADRGEKRKKKGRATGTPEVLRFKGTATFSLISALIAETNNAPELLQKAFLLPEYHQQQYQQQQQMQQQQQQRQQQIDPAGLTAEEIKSLSLILHLLGRLADELKVTSTPQQQLLLRLLLLLLLPRCSAATAKLLLQ